MNTNKNLQWGVVFSYITMAVNLVVSILYTPFLLDSLGQQQYGLYNLGQSVVSYLCLAEFGFGNAVVRYAAKYRAEGRLEETADLYGMFMRIYGVLAAGIFVVGTTLCIFSDKLFIVTTGAEGYRQLKIIMMIMVINLTFTFATQTYSSIINSYERFAFLKITNLIYILLKPLTMIPLLIWGYKAITLSLVSTVLNMAMHIANIIYVKKVLKVSINMKPSTFDKNLLREIIGYSTFIFITTIVAQINDNTGQIILGAVAGELAVAIYAVGYQLNTYIQQIPSTISGVLFPRITAKVSAGATAKELSALMLRVGRIQFFIAFLMCSGFALFGQEFIALWAGEEYAVAYWIVLSLIIPAMIPNIQTVAAQVVMAMNKHQFRAVAYLICAVLNVIASIPAAMAYGPLGCAVCTGITTLLTKGLMINWYYSQKIHLDMTGFWKNILGLLLRFLPLCLIGIGMNMVFHGQSWLWLVVKIAVYTACFAAYVLFACMNQEEKQLLKGVLKRGH